jgi:SnoaL-like domain
MGEGQVRREVLRSAAPAPAAARSADDGYDVGRLPDIEAIQQLKARYFRALDLRLWDLFASVWTADAHLEQTLTGDLVDGRDAIVEFVRRSLSPFESVHHGHTPEITITDGNTAHGIWAFSGLIAVPGTHPVKGFTDHGYYTEDYARQNGVWRISRSRLDILRLDPLPGGLPAS